jgi:recombination protein RecT
MASDEKTEPGTGVAPVVKDAQVAELGGPGSVGPPQEKHYDAFRRSLVARREEFEGALVGWMSADHFIEVATTAYLRDEGLWKADKVSLYSALRKAAQLNLRPDGEEGYLEVWKNKGKNRLEVTFNPMYKGFIRTLTRSGTVLHVDPQVVRSGDEFDFQLGDEPFVRHKPEKDPKKRGGIVYCYAIFHLANGLRHREVMSVEEMDEIRENAKKRRDEGPAWRTNADQMYRKMPIKRGVKYLDLNPTQAAVFRYDDELERGVAREPGDDVPEAEFRTLDQRAQAHAAQRLDDLRRGMQRMEGSRDGGSAAPEESGAVVPIVDQLVGFGTHRDKTWGELAEKQRGYITHYAVLADECPWIDDDTRRALRAWMGMSDDPTDQPTEAAPVPDSSLMADLLDRGRSAVVEMRDLGAFDDDSQADASAEINMAHDEGSYFALHDAVDELERAVASKRAEKTGDLFGGGRA